jgi:hypothetical protein
MFARKLGSMILAAVASLALLGCQSSDSTPAKNPQSDLPAEKKVKPKPIRKKADENSLLVRLLMSEAVQKDIGLTADQIVKINDTWNNMKEQGQEFKAKWSGSLVIGVVVHMSEEESRKFYADFSDFQKQQKNSRAQAVAILTPSQSERLKQIQLQQSMEATLTRPNIVKELEISEEQLAKLNSLIDDFFEDRKNTRLEFDALDRNDRHKKFFEFAKERDKAEAEENKRALEVLTLEQRKKLENFWGKEIEVTWDYEALLKPDDLIFDVPERGLSD